MAEVVQLAKPGAQTPEPGGFVMKESAQQILRTLQLVGSRGGGDIALISAAPGVGKTQAIWHFKHHIKPQAWLFVAVAKEVRLGGLPVS